MRLVATGFPSLITVQSPSQKSNCRLSERDSHGNCAAVAHDAATAPAARNLLALMVEWCAVGDAVRVTGCCPRFADLSPGVGWFHKANNRWKESCKRDSRSLLHWHSRSC